MACAAGAIDDGDRSCARRRRLAWPGLAPVRRRWMAVLQVFSSDGAGWRIATCAVGSPPNGFSAKIAKPAKIVRNRPSKTASACIPVNGSRNRRCGRTVSCPSGVLRSSAVSAMGLPESTAPTIPRRGQFAGVQAFTDVPGYRATPWNRSTKRATRGPPFCASSPETGSVFLGSGFVGNRRLVDCRLVARGLVVGRRRCRGVDLDAMQQVVRHLQSLVVLGVRRHIRL